MKLPAQTAAAGPWFAGRALGVATAAALLLQGSSLANQAPQAGCRALETAPPAAVKTAPDPCRPAWAKLAPAVRAELRDRKQHTFVVQLRRPAASRDIDALRRAGAHVTRRYHCLPMAAITAGGRAIIRLASLPAVTRISPDLRVRRCLDYAAPAVGADVARTQYGYTGKGIGVAVIDSGIYASQDLTSPTNLLAYRIVGGYDYIANSTAYSNNDACGHGSNVAGIIAGNGFQSSYTGKTSYCTRHFIGIAPQANLVNLRVLDQYGQGTVSNAIAALDWCISHKSLYNIRVANLSLGYPPGESCTTDPLCQACEQTWNNGILVVCAAGNRGRVVASDPTSGVAYATINAPGNDPYVLTVGATNDLKTLGTGDDTVATYSSRGPSRLDHILKPDLVAPGNRIIAIRHPGSYLETVLGPQNLTPLSYYWNNPPKSTSLAYYSLSGTSMAAAVVSGAGAILFQQDPTLTPDDVKARLMKTAIKTWRTDGTTYDIYSRGAGYLNIPAALQCTDLVTSPAISPTVVNTSTGVTLQNALWGDNAIWGDNALWGDNAIWGENAIWGDNALWSDTALWSDNALWGDVDSLAVNGE